MMPAFFGKRIANGAEMSLKIFAPPPEGVNDPAQGGGWETDYYATLCAAPKLRIRYAPTETL
jgi:hypothetical protein